VNVRKLWVSTLGVLHILLFKVLQLRDKFFLPATESLEGEEIIVIVSLFKMANDVQKLFFAVEMVLVCRVGNLVRNTIDLNKVLLQTLEDHSAENGLIV